MKIPKYVQDLMSRAKFAKGYGDPGYTIEITKETPYTYASTLESEVKRLESWVKRMMPEDDLGAPTMVINTKFPMKTRHCNRYAVVTIYDPIMKYDANTALSQKKMLFCWSP